MGFDRMLRWVIAIVATVAAFFLTWAMAAVLDASVDVALGLAGLAATVVALPLGVWAAQDKNRDVSAPTVIQVGQIKILHVYGVVPVRLTPISRWGTARGLVGAFVLLAGGLVLLRSAVHAEGILTSALLICPASVILLAAYALADTTWQRWRLSSGRYDDVLGEQVRAATKSLAKALAENWKREERLRRLQDPSPLPVRWENADSLADHWQNIRADGKDERPIDLAGSLGSARDIGDVFDGIPSRRLVIIGNAGAGKRVIALRFAKSRLNRRESDEDPVPVIFSLASWDPDQDFWEWVTQRLVFQHPELAVPTGIDTTLAAELIRARRIAPILDGLDELPATARAKALPALNKALDAPDNPDGPPILLTSRTREYREAVDKGDVLTGAAVVELKPLSITDLEDYLPLTAKPVGPNSSTKWHPVLVQLRNKPSDPGHAQLLQALATPLMASLARIAYSDTHADPQQLLSFPTRQGLERHLLDRFLPSVYAESELANARPPGSPPWLDR